MADPNILMGIKTAQFMNPLDAAAQAAQVKRANLQNAMFQQETDTQTKLDKAYQLAGGDVSKMQADPSIGYKAGMEIGALKSQQAQNAFKAQNEKLDYLLKSSEYTAQKASAVQDQAGWDALRVETGQILGQDAMAHMPAQFSPQARDQYVAGTMSFKDRIAQQRADQQATQQDRMYNATMERIAASERNAAARGDGGDKTKYTIIYDAQGNAYTKNVNAPDEPPIPMRMPDSVSPSGQTSPTGTPAQQPPASFRKAVSQPSEKAFTLDQSNSATYGLRAKQADESMSEVGADYNPVSIAAKRGAGNIPMVGGALEMGANAKLTPNEQKVDQAQLNFLTAVLRKESGATIGPSEIENGNKQYFPQPGDSPEVLAQKAQNRATAIAGLKNAAGPAWMEDNKQSAQNSKQIVRTGTVNGRKVVQYSDGTKEYAE